MCWLFFTGQAILARAAACISVFTFQAFSPCAGKAFEGVWSPSLQSSLSFCAPRFRRPALKLLLGLSALMASWSATFGDSLPYDRNSNQGEGWYPNVFQARTARESPWHSGPTPDWTNTAGFDKDVFSFARVRYTRLSRSRQVWWNGGYWFSDYPDSDLNLSYRLQQLSSIKVNPNGR